MDSPASEVVTMERIEVSTAPPTEVAPEDRGWLRRFEIDQVIESMSARDLVDAMDRFDPKTQSTQYAIAAFDSAADRATWIVSNGSPASAHVRMADFAYLASAIGGAVNIDAPLSEGQEG